MLPKTPLPAIFFMGYNFNETFGAELGYQYAGRGSTNGGINNNTGETQGGTLSGIARLPLARISPCSVKRVPTGVIPMAWV